MNMDFIVPARPRLRDALVQMAQVCQSIWRDHWRSRAAWRRHYGTRTWQTPAGFVALVAAVLGGGFLIGQGIVAMLPWVR